MKTVTIKPDLTDTEAWQLAQFLKRVDLATYKQWAEDENTAYLMMQAGEKVRKALAEEGYAPR